MRHFITLLYYIYQVCVLLPVTILSTAFFGITATIMPHFGNGTWWGNFCGHYWGRSLVRTTLVPVKVTGRENIKPGQSYILVANHQGCYDIFLIFGFINRPIRWMMKVALRKVPFIGSSCQETGQIFVDNSSPAKVKQNYQQAREVLKNGVSLMVFPEGCRTHTGKMGPFKRGAYTLADELQLPVVPMTINGSFDIMPRHRDFHFAHWHPLSLTIHEPIYPQGQGAENIKYLMEESRKAINSQLPDNLKDK